MIALIAAVTAVACAIATIINGARARESARQAHHYETMARSYADMAQGIIPARGLLTADEERQLRDDFYATLEDTTAMAIRKRQRHG